MVRLLAVLAATVALPVFAAPPTYAVSGTIAGVDGGWDYASVDTSANQLYVARTDAVMAVDLATGKVTDKLAPAQKAHSVLPIPGSGALLETDGTTGLARLIDARTGAERWAVQVGEKPDAAIWDARLKRVIIMNNKGGTIALVDVSTGKVTGTIKMTRGLEFAAIDKRGMLWVNNEEDNTVTPVNLKTMQPLTPIKLSGCDGATGLAYASKLDEIVSVCGSGVADVTDARTRKQISSIVIGKGADAAMVDNVRGIIAVPCGDDGVLEILDISGQKVKRVATVVTEKSARTGAIDPATGKIYLPAAQFEGADAAGGRPKMVAGSFHLIVVSVK